MEVVVAYLKIIWRYSAGWKSRKSRTRIVVFPKLWFQSDSP